MSQQEQDFQRWTAKRKAAVVLEVLRNQVAGVDACRKYGIKQPELEAWTAQFLEGGENSLRSNPRDEQMLYEAKIEELTLERHVLEKSVEQIESREKKS